MSVTERLYCSLHHKNTVGFYKNYPIFAESMSFLYYLNHLIDLIYIEEVFTYFLKKFKLTLKMANNPETALSLPVLRKKIAFSL